MLREILRKINEHIDILTILLNQLHTVLRRRDEERKITEIKIEIKSRRKSELIQREMKSFE